MSTSRESIILVVLANLVLSILVVAGALTFFDDDARRDPALDRIEDRLDDFEAGIKQFAGAPGVGGTDLETFEANLTNRLTELRDQVESLEDRIDRRISDLRTRILAAAEAGGTVPSPGGEDASAALKPSSGSEGMMQAFGKMMVDRLKRERDRYIEGLMNPTEESEARQNRRVKGMARRSSQNLGLDEAQSAALEQVLLDVDTMRRDQFRALLQSKSDPEEVTQDEVEKILKESFEEEDRRVSQTLPREKAEQYQSDAKPMRQMMTGMARSMFNE